jgi:acyl dehydratase
MYSWFLIRDGLGLFLKHGSLTVLAYGRVVGSWQNQKNHPIKTSLAIKYLDINHRTK